MRLLSQPISAAISAAVLKRSLAAALAVAMAVVLTPASPPYAAGETRTITFFNIHNNETTTIPFKKDGQFLPGALDKFNWAFRDWRKNEPTKMDPALIDLLWEIHTELGSKQPIHIISGYRSRGTNEALRASVGGQASESRHILGKAADVHFPDIPLKALRYSALIRERGGVGYYPTSAIEFVHIDTDRVRHWPRLPRFELALLFPTGKSQHQPADGGPITPEDVRVARSTHRDLASQVAAFFDSRAGRRPPVAIAGLDPNFKAAPGFNAPNPGGNVQVAAYTPPKLIEPPRLVDRPSQLAAPNAAARASLTDLIQRASFTPSPPAAAAPAVAAGEPRLIAPPTPASRPRAATAAASVLPPVLEPAPSASFVSAPDFDEDHPEELSYRPFPIAPLMTTTASADDPALATMIHPDVARTLDFLDQAGSAPPMRMRPSLKVAQQLWSQGFTGNAVNLSALQAPAAIPSAVADRKVRTQ